MAQAAAELITEYKKWKEHGESLRAQARRAMEVRFKELLTEAAHIAADYQSDFGATLKPPPPVTAFRVKAGVSAGTAKSKVPTVAASATAESKIPAPPVAGPKVAALQRKLAAAKRKLDVAKASGASTKTLEDKIYEIEDDLRLAQSVGG